MFVHAKVLLAALVTLGSSGTQHQSQTAKPRRPLTNQIYEIVSVQSGLALDVYGISLAGGAPIQIWPYWGGANQQWRLVPGIGNNVGIVNIHSGMALDIPWGNSAPGTPLQQYGWWNGPMQNWNPVPQSDGSFEFVNAQTGQCLDVAGGSSQAGARLQEWNCWGGPGQRWQLVPVGSVNNFLTRNGTQLILNNAPYRMTGYNGSPPDTTNYCGWSGTDLQNSTARMASASGANTIRIWFLQSAGGPGNWASFDAAVLAAKQNNLRIVATLVNQWGNCEPQVNGQENYKTIQWYQNGYKQAGDGYPLAYRDFAIAVAQRYAYEPAIAMWQLVNEAEAREPISNTCPNDAASAAAIRTFADDMVDAIHSVDTQHLINLGTQDNGWCGVGGQDFGYVHAGKIDVCETHVYDPANQALPAAVADQINQCAALGKPLFIGEIGICRNAQADGTCSGGTTAQSLQQRAAFYDAHFQAAFNAGAAGSLLWIWTPSATDGLYDVNAGDPIEGVMSKY